MIQANFQTAPVGYRQDVAPSVEESERRRRLGSRDPTHRAQTGKDLTAERVIAYDVAKIRALFLRYDPALQTLRRS
jgi:hypothetical protein